MYILLHDTKRNYVPVSSRTDISVNTKAHTKHVHVHKQRKILKVIQFSLQKFFKDFFYLLVLYRVSQEECEILRESVPYVKLYRYNPKHLYPKLNGYGDNGQRSLKL